MKSVKSFKAMVALLTERKAGSPTVRLPMGPMFRTLSHTYIYIERTQVQHIMAQCMYK